MVRIEKHGHTHPADSVSGLSDLLSEKLDASRFLSGTGFPEGKTSAPVGTIYTDTAATAGAVRWIKTSGTGTTGWRVDWGDTGWRSINSYFAHLSSATSNINISRFGPRVELIAHAITFDVAGVPAWSKVADLPADFAPKFSFRQVIAQPNVVLEFRSSGAIHTLGTPLDKGAVVAFKAGWASGDAWPISRPGTPS